MLVGKRLQTARILRGWTQPQLSDRTWEMASTNGSNGVSVQTISKIENGAGFRPRTIVKLAAALEVDTENWFSDVSDEAHGSYNINHKIAGEYFVFRKDFGDPDSSRIVGFYANIQWNNNKCVYEYHEKHNYKDGNRSIKYNIGGNIYISSYLNALSILTIWKGGVRLINVRETYRDRVCRMLHGIMATNVDLQPMGFLPGITPLCAIQAYGDYRNIIQDFPNGLYKNGSKYDFLKNKLLESSKIIIHKI